IDRSDYELKGALNNVLSYFRGDSILRGDFRLFSNNTDLNQLMYLTSGIGMEDENKDTNTGMHVAEDSLSEPYMVPEGIEFKLSARINQLINSTDTATNIRGDVLIHDGILVLDDLIFTSPAADMQLTAMYRTPRKNHLYLGIDYHMLDVEISRLLQMIPDIDILMPMLRSFSGSGEFHIAAETYLDSAYNIKMSTLRGASSIVGHDLVLMDGETFSEIAKKLRFSRKAENRVDSLSAEFTIFREEIDIYPFLIVMDKYKAVVGGRHNLDMSFNYHISLVESPLPVRLGIDINGTLEELHYKPVSPRYAEFYRPASRRAVESNQLELRRLIREALIRKVEKTEEQGSDGVGGAETL
ncbi:MAG: AsmA-like C-terminal region-containing protein, partial [Bacteroidales bacterium]